MNVVELWDSLAEHPMRGILQDSPRQDISAIYALYSTAGDVVYVGRSTDLRARLHAHRNDLTKINHGWSHWRAWPCSLADQQRLETYLIGLWSPPLNLVDKPMATSHTAARTKVIGWRVTQAEWATFFPILGTFPQCTFSEMMYWLFDLPCVQEAMAARLNSPLRNTAE